MRQFGVIYRFELKGYMKNKIFVGVTLFLVLALGVLLFFPRIAGLFSGDGDAPADEDRPVMLLAGQGQDVQNAFAAAFPDYEVRPASPDDVQERITAGQAECAFVLDGLARYTYYVNDLSLYDTNTEVADEVLGDLCRLAAMTDSGLSPEQAADILSLQVEHSLQALGTDQGENFFYTYIMIFALYMVILLYGQMVSTGVATEKSSRAMEVLVTSARPTAMMFGKVLAACTAGLVQLVAVFGSALLFYRINRAHWGGGIIDLFFDMPPALLGYMLLFFLLGFFLYAFLFGAVGSLANKVEDLNTSTMPVILLFVAGFMLVVFSMSSGSIDNTLMKVCSYVPFTAPMAMFTRIAMSVVPWYEIAISSAVLVCSVVLTGILSAKIYRVGVLLYGTTPKLGSVLRSLRRA